MGTKLKWLEWIKMLNKGFFLNFSNQQKLACRLPHQKYLKIQNEQHENLPCSKEYRINLWNNENQGWMVEGLIKERKKE